jgi:hypothetical protein
MPGVRHLLVFATQSIMKNFVALLLTILLPALLFAQTSTANQSLVLTHVTVIDMTGAPSI